MPPELQAVLSKADSLVVKAKGAVLSSARDIRKEILFLANQLDIAGSAENREAVFAQVSKKILKLNKRLSSLFAYMDEMTVKKAGKAATEATGLQVKISNAHAKEIINAVTKGGSGRLAATMTTSMNNNIVTALREATVSAFREQAVGGLTQKELEKVLLQKWQAVAEDPANLQFVDKNGRVWDTDTYINMNVRTNAMNVYNDALVESIGKATGSDLVMVSRGGDPNCKLCFPWEGRILSITGKTKGFPTYEEAKAAGLFHPNCVHTLDYVDEELDADEIDLQRQFKPPKEMTAQSMDDQRYEIDISRKMLQDGMTAAQAKVAVDRDNLAASMRQGLVFSGADDIVAGLTDEQVNALCPDGNPPEFLPTAENDGEAAWNKGSRGGVVYIDRKDLKSADALVEVTKVEDGKPVEEPELETVAHPPQGESDADAVERLTTEANARFDAWFARTFELADRIDLIEKGIQSYQEIIIGLRQQIADYAAEKGRDSSWVARYVPQDAEIMGLLDKFNEHTETMNHLRERFGSVLADEFTRKHDALDTTDRTSLEAFVDECETNERRLKTGFESLDEVQAAVTKIKETDLRTANALVQTALSVIDSVVKSESGETFTRNTVASLGFSAEEVRELKNKPLGEALTATTKLNDGLEQAVVVAEQKKAETNKYRDAEKQKLRDKYGIEVADLEEAMVVSRKTEKTGLDGNPETVVVKVPIEERIALRQSLIEKMGWEKDFARYQKKNDDEWWGEGYIEVRNRWNQEKREWVESREAKTKEQIAEHNSNVLYRFLFYKKQAVTRKWNKEAAAIDEEVTRRRFNDSVLGQFALPTDEQSVVQYSAPSSRESKAKTMQFVAQKIISKNVVPNEKCGVQAHRGRAYQSGHFIYLDANDGAETYLHEYAHFIEEFNLHVHLRCLEFLKMRCDRDDNQIVSLRKIAGRGYSADEVCVPDKFFNPYCGKLYGDYKEGEYPQNRASGRGYRSSATEILSMGIQKLYSDPEGFYKSDREYFDFVLNLLQGVI